jgi:uncharacterized membrane protein YbhN (UPF0104 family)
VKERRRRLVGFGLAVALSAALLWLLLRRLDSGAVARAFAAAAPAPLLAAACLALVVNLPFSALALRSALRAHRVELAVSACLRATVGHLALHALGTFVVGKGARALHLARAHGVEPGRAVAAETVLLALKLAAALALMATGALASGELGLPTSLAISLAAGATLGAGAFALRRSVDLRQLVLAFGWVFGMGLGQVVVFALSLAALGAHVPSARLLALFPLCLLGAKLPVAVLGLGVRESVVVLLLSGAAPAETLLAASLLFAAVEQLLPGMLGVIAAPRFVAGLRAERPAPPAAGP